MTAGRLRSSFFRTAAIVCCATLGATQLANIGLASTARKGAISASAPKREFTRTPIRHVIIIVGENRTYDHFFATYVPPKGFTKNLLSEGIVNADGSPGPHFNLAAQSQATDTTTYSISPTTTSAYTTLPAPTTTSAPQSASDSNPPPFATTAAAGAADYGIETGDLAVLTTGATGLPLFSVDTRIPNVQQLPDGPFPLTGLYDAYTAGPVHRFFQNWQQMDCNASYAVAGNPSGCRQDLFPWVEVTAGFSGDNATNMGFYNVQQGDMPYFKSLVDSYALGDNYHQPIAGGTGANSLVLGYAGTLWYSDGLGHPQTPPASQIENPNPRAGTNNSYTNDSYFGGSYVNCSDSSQPGVAVIRDYLKALARRLPPSCGAGKYYLVNNFNPGFNADGTRNTGTLTIPPSSQRSIGDVLNERGISWAYYGEDWNLAVANQTSTYCAECNPFQYETAVMTDKVERHKHLKDTIDLYAALDAGKLPAIAYVKPGSLNDGHPVTSKFSIFEAFTKKILDKLSAHPELFAHTAVFITVDEGGGYYDSGYVQPLDFFGDGSRIPLIVVSPYSQGVGVVHEYADHASILKFIEANWYLPPVGRGSRDSLPDPVQARSDPYVVTNGPAIGDLMDFFNFRGK